jgi:hypothetical protein
LAGPSSSKYILLEKDDKTELILEKKSHLKLITSAQQVQLPRRLEMIFNMEMFGVLPG